MPAGSEQQPAGRGEQVDLPPYAGSADSGVADSVPPQDPARGDVVAVVRSSHETLQRLLDDVDGLLRGAGPGPDPDAPDPLAHDAASSPAVVGGWRGRWPGVVRSLLEQLDAEGRVAWPAVDDGAEAGPAARARSLSADLREVDGLDLRDVDADRVAALVSRSRDELHALDETLLPRLEALPADQRAALGEDLRQVLG